VHPIDADAARARSETFASTRSSIRLGMLICVLIFAGVVPLYLLGTFVPLLICAPLIALIALVKGIGLLAPGGGVDQAYGRVDVAMKPLGLRMSERPQVGIKPRYATSPGWQTSVTGSL